MCWYEKCFKILGHYKLQKLNLACECNAEGSIGTACSDSGQCDCKDNVEGLPCDHCKDEHFGFPTCEGNYNRLYHGMKFIY